MKYINLKNMQASTVFHLAWFKKVWDIQDVAQWIKRIVHLNKSVLDTWERPTWFWKVIARHVSFDFWYFILRWDIIKDYFPFIWEANWNIIFFLVKRKAEACGIVRAPIPNDYHKGYLGNCTAPNTCIKNKCVTGSTQYDFLNIQDIFSL